jgi:hypothetical protein
VSFNDGEMWRSLSLNLPDVPASDAWIEENSIALSTHGRSFHVLDDLAVLRQLGIGGLGVGSQRLRAPSPEPRRPEILT